MATLTADVRKDMAARLIRLRFAATCSGCSASLVPTTKGWWDGDERTTRCVTCGPSSGPEVAPLPMVAAPDPRARTTTTTHLAAAGGSAQRIAGRKRAARKATVHDRHPHLGGLILAITPEPQSTKNWDIGAVGERKLGGGLDSLISAGVIALHDRRRPRTTANIDHIAVAASGVWVIDAKRYIGQVTRKDVGGWLSTDVRLFVGRRDCTKLLTGMAKQVDAVRTALGAERADVPVRPVLCFIDTDWRWFASPFELDGVLVTWPRALRELVVRAGPYAPTSVERIAARLDARLPPTT